MISSNEQQVFEFFAKAWQGFEHDGLNHQIIQQYIPRLKKRVTVAGAGWGLISKALVDAGLKVISLDKVAEMACMAKDYRGIEVQTIDFLKYNSEEPTDSLVINTGVISPTSVDQDAYRIAEAAFRNVTPGGVVLAAFHERTTFDDLAQFLGLDTSTPLLQELCQQISDGASIIEALHQSSVADRFTNFLAIRFLDDLKEMERQISFSLKVFREEGMPEYWIETVLPSELRHKPFGLNVRRQINLANAFENTGFNIISSDKHDNTIVTMMTKDA